MALLLMLALLLAPTVIQSSHGPGAIYLAQKADLAKQAHGHSHDQDAVGQHDATDHEHQVSAILPGTAKSGFTVQSAVLFRDMPLADGHSRDGPRRPPRDALI